MVTARGAPNPPALDVRPCDEPSTLLLVLRGRVRRADVPHLCERGRALLESSEARIVVCDVRDLAPDAVTVETLARLRLAARRRGCEVSLRAPSDRLLELLDLVGLSETLPPCET